MQWHPAPAKLNLFLHVLGRRPDGYHRLQTLFQLIDWQDEIGIEVTTDGRIERVGEVPGVPAEEDLCLRAARLLRNHIAATSSSLPVDYGARISLRKRLPIGGGVGGGSSDAATVLIVLNRLWNLGLRRTELQSLAQRLGADVPFFVFGRNAVASGIGEVLAEHDPGNGWYLVISSEVPVSTKEIFSDPALTRDTPELKIPPFFPGLGRNDLEPVVCRKFPGVRERLEWLRERSRHARMTGSGGCVFARFESEMEAQEALADVPAGFHARLARALRQHPRLEWTEN